MKPIRIFNHTMHKELWQWIADNPSAYAQQWPGWYEYGISKNAARDFNFCTACACVGMTRTWQTQFCNEYTHDYGALLYVQRNLLCVHCPLDWGYSSEDGHQLCCWEEEGLHSNFENAYDFRDIEEYALAIRDLPLREDQNFITIVK